MSRESKFQSDLIVELDRIFSSTDKPYLIFKTDPTYLQGIPDLMILFDDKWASLECKRSSKDRHQPNQDFYVDMMNNMSFSSFIYPENMMEVLDELQCAFGI